MSNSRLTSRARTAAPLACLMLACAPALADEGWSVGGSLAVFTDYVYRGVSQTDEKPALQGSVDVGHGSGFYAGAWASNVDFAADDGIDLEVNLYVGWAVEFRDGSELDLQLVRYLYPGARTGFGINYNEFIAAYSFADYFTATFAYTNDYLNSDETAFYYRLGAEFPMGVADLNLTIGFGYNDISRLAGSDYWDYQLGLNRSWGPFMATLDYFGTSGFNSRVQDVLGPRDWANGRVVLGVTFVF